MKPLFKMNPFSSYSRRVIGAPLLLLAAALALAFLESGSGAETGPPKAWLTKLADAKAAAARDHKPVFAMVSSNDCVPCEIMKRDVIPKESVAAALKEYVDVYINADDDPDDAKTLNIEGFPSFIVLDEKGAEQGRFIGLRETPEAFLGELSAIEKVAGQLADLDKKLADALKDPALWKSRGDVLTNAGRRDDGIAAYQNAASADPQDKTGAKEDLEFFSILKKIDDDGDRAAGLKALAAFAQNHPDHQRVEDSIYTRAYLTALMGDWPASKALIADYQKRFPKGRMASRAERLQKAVDDQIKTSATASQSPKTP